MTPQGPWWWPNKITQLYQTMSHLSKTEKAQGNIRASRCPTRILSKYWSRWAIGYWLTKRLGLIRFIAKSRGLRIMETRKGWKKCSSMSPCRSVISSIKGLQLGKRCQISIQESSRGFYRVMLLAIKEGAQQVISTRISDSVLWQGTIRRVLKLTAAQMKARIQNRIQWILS